MGTGLVCVDPGDHLGALRPLVHHPRLDQVDGVDRPRPQQPGHRAHEEPVEGLQEADRPRPVLGRVLELDIHQPSGHILHVHLGRELLQIRVNDALTSVDKIAQLEENINLQRSGLGHSLSRVQELCFGHLLDSGTSGGIQIDLLHLLHVGQHRPEGGAVGEGQRVPLGLLDEGEQLPADLARQEVALDGDHDITELGCGDASVPVTVSSFKCILGILFVVVVQKLAELRVHHLQIFTLKAHWQPKKYLVNM